MTSITFITGQEKIATTLNINIDMKWYDIAKILYHDTYKNIVALTYENEQVRLNDNAILFLKDKNIDLVSNSECTIKPIYITDPEGLKIYWSLAIPIFNFVLAELYGCKARTSGLTQEGFYCDVEHIQGQILDPETITNYFLEFIKDKKATLATGYIPHINHIAAIKILSINNTIDENVKRIRAITFNTNSKKQSFEQEYERRKEYSHQIIGQKQKLFFSHVYSPGSFIFLPHGTIMLNKLFSIMRSFYLEKDFKEVITPNIYHKQLYIDSGHYAHYKDNMFKVDCDNTEYFLKPMNCPGHCLIFKHETKSYNDLPIRYADFGVLHRNELSGTLTGLTRVRKFCQDDAHIFCTRDQIEGELINAINFLDRIYKIFGFTYHIELSTRPEKFQGAIDLWDLATSTLQKVIQSFTENYVINEGDGAFYGPKIDFHIVDKFNRRHQCATIQLDFVLPEQFKLEYIDKNNNAIRPVMIHRAIYGSVERFLALVTEHYEGTYPFWLSPRQIMILPLITSNYVDNLYQDLKKLGYHVDIDESDNSLGKKIAKYSSINERYNYLVIIGRSEVDKGMVSIRKFSSVAETIATNVFFEMLANDNTF